MHRCLSRLAALLALLATAPGAVAETASAWVEAQRSQARLIAGRQPEAQPGEFVAGVEISMPKGWKTYWRSPGETGVPPEFDWSASQNLASAEVLYPVPRQLADAAGVTLGYVDRVTFPVVVRAREPDMPVELRLGLRYGVCKEICVPTEVSLALPLSPQAAKSGLPGTLAAALDRVPRSPSERRPDDPALVGSQAELLDNPPRIVLRARFPGDTTGAEAFLEGPEGTFLPNPKTVSIEGEHVRFEAYVSPEDLAALKGKLATATFVGPSGQSTATVKLE